MVKYFLIVTIVVGLITSFLFLYKDSIFKDKIPTMMVGLPNIKSDQNINKELKFSNPQKSAHYESNTPEHASILAGVPVNIVIDFNFDLAKPSEIKILKDNKDVGIGETTIDSNKLTLRRKINSDVSDGLYKVEYKACWPDGSCHDGFFEFAIDKSKSKEFIDRIGKKEVTIDMNDITFNPKNVKVSKGTKIIWINTEGVGHYTNTDSHPAHSYFSDQNSKLLNKGDTFEVVFQETGIYPYHCSVHASSMTGAILVE